MFSEHLFEKYHIKKVKILKISEILRIFVFIYCEIFILNTNNTCRKPTQSPIFYYAVLIIFLFLAQLLGLIPFFAMPDGPFKGLAFALVNAAALLIPLALITKKHGALSVKETFRTNKKAPVKAYLFAIIATAGIVAAGDAITTITYISLPDVAKEFFEKMYLQMEEPYRKLFYSENKALLPIALFAAAIMPAFYEEFAFRGYLQKNTESLMKPMRAIIGASIIFTLIHMNAVGSIQIFGLAMIFGYMVYKTDCIWVGFVAHALNNIYAITLMNLSEDTSLASLADVPIWSLLVRIAVGAILLWLAISYFRKLPTPDSAFIPREKDKSTMFENYK